MAQASVKRGEGWGYALWARLSCGHLAELLVEWVSSSGYVGRVQCTTCRRIDEGVVLEGWA